MDDRDLVRALKALADPKRFRMVQEIAEAGELSCGQVADRFHVSQPTISHHLGILRQAGLIDAEKVGPWMWYRRNDASLRRLARALGDAL